MGIEPMRSENSSFLDCRLNHSAKVSVAWRLSRSTPHSLREKLVRRHPLPPQAQRAQVEVRVALHVLAPVVLQSHPHHPHHLVHQQVPESRDVIKFHSKVWVIVAVVVALVVGLLDLYLIASVELQVT